MNNHNNNGNNNHNNNKQTTTTTKESNSYSELFVGHNSKLKSVFFFVGMANLHWVITVSVGVLDSGSTRPGAGRPLAPRSPTSVYHRRLMPDGQALPPETPLAITQQVMSPNGLH